ncbi:MAG: CBS domain-containing protein [Gammaproteobacteria bacterium]|nr:CBS domain-containing protein [Gammaproteobacteria bacterium]
MKAKNIVRVKDVMKTGINLVEGMETVAHVLKNAPYPESKIFIVEKRNDDDEYGVVVLSDIAKNVLAKDKSPERVNIYEIMSKPAVHVDSEMDIRYCTRYLEALGLSRVAVIDNKKVVGVIGYTDIVLQGIRDNL